MTINTHHPADDTRPRDTWWEDAACREADPTIFSDPDLDVDANRKRREKRAKRVCAECVVQRQCLAEALRRGEPQGVWGGMTARERRALLRRRRRGT